MNPTKVKVMDEKFETYKQMFLKVHNDSEMSKIFGVGSVATKDRLEIESRIANGLIIDIDKATFFEMQKK